ncbi:hypothetical protein TNCV_3839531 [Trichonephila clavipes]|nr:hypothetical protein TNCV_3839531 [Trichonephila clavipes]
MYNRNLLATLYETKHLVANLPRTRLRKSEDSYEISQQLPAPMFLCVVHTEFATRSDRDMIESGQTIALRYPHSRNSQGFKSGDLGDKAVGKCGLMILSSPKWRQSTCFTQRAMCRGVPSVDETVENSRD